MFIRGRFVRLRRLHELNCCPIGVANVDDALSCVRSRFECLRFTRRFPTGCGKRVQHRIKIVYGKRNVDVSDIAGSKIDVFSVGWGEVLKQFNLVTVAFDSGERNFGAGHAGDSTRKLTRLMCPMRELEAEYILPESERALEVRDRDACVIRRTDAKWTRDTASFLTDETRDQTQIDKTDSALDP